jgi:hypothetical protein
MNISEFKPRKTSTAALVASYLQDHLEGVFAAPVVVAEIPKEEPAPPAVDPDIIRVLNFMVGPFRFLCPMDAALAAAPDSPCAMVIEAADLVPEPYRAQLRQGLQHGRDSVWLKGGRLEIRGCRLEQALEIRQSRLTARGPRAAAPWIGATLREPPAFVLDPDATQLHFMRRLRPAE